ncbi:hypothetical protein C0J52_12647 [Blattella germanica]|nr:hypothetical protein C0J52_12647 [Blattella germanica]
MVFESLVVELLNKVLGDYVENLDYSQLKIGIWGGDVVLQDLILKGSALDDLNLPVKTIYGKIGKLVLKIPWKNLWNSPLEASVEGLYLLAVPNQGVKYDPIKEEKWAQEAKQKQLRMIEEAKKLEKGREDPDHFTAMVDNFVEKLAVSIVKNVQVKVTDIHIRIEDKVTKPLHPFSLGITLHSLSVHTTDENWKKCVIEGAVTKIYKVLELEGLALYWNNQSPLYADTSTEEIPNVLKAGIWSKTVVPKDYKYMVGPINSFAKLRLNPKPENDGSNYTIPKVELSLDMEGLSVGIGRFQYHDIMDLMESFNRMLRAAPYRKYRPFVSSFKGHYKEWWKFAFTCVLEETVRRRRRNWDWDHISRHRRVCHNYADAYKSKLTSKKISAELQSTIDNCEKILDVLNIVLIRQRIEVEVERQDRKEKEMQKKKSGWFGAKKFEEAMTPEEKAKLYRAIDYQENAAPQMYPKFFIEHIVTFRLHCLSAEVRDDSLLVPRVLSGELKGVAFRFEHRPSANAVKITAQIEELAIYGLKQHGMVPHLVSSKEQKSKALLDVLFETNPLDGSCDQRIHLFSKPLKVIYDAETILKAQDVFTAPKEVDLSDLQATAGSRFADFKEMSATGLQHAIEKQTILDLKVDLQAPYIIIPHSGFYTGKENVLVVNLGSMKMISVPRDKTMSPNVRALHSQGTTEEEIMKTMISQSYDQFKINLEQVQILIAVDDEDWKTALTVSEGTAMHLLLPTNLSIQFSKCLVMDDPRLPKMKVVGHLPNMEINITDSRLLQVLALLTSFKFTPDSHEPPPPSKTLQESGSRSSSMSTLNKFMDYTSDLGKMQRASKVNLPNVATIPSKSPEEFVQFTEVDLSFKMGELKVSIHQASEDEKLLDLNVVCIEVETVVQTYEMKVILRIGGINCTHFDPIAPVCIMDTPLTSADAEYLLTIMYQDVDKKNPEFHTKHGSVLRTVDFNFTTLNVLLQQESLLALLAAYNTFNGQLEEVLKSGKDDDAAAAVVEVAVMPTKQPLSVIHENEVAVQFVETVSKPKKKKMKAVKEIDLKLIANLKHFKVEIGTRKTNIASLLVQGAVAGITIKKNDTVVNAKLKDIVILDPQPETIHPKFPPFTLSKPKKKKMKAVKEIDLKLIANLKHFKVEIGTRKTNIASLLVQGAVAGITIKKNDTVVNAKLKDIVILDPQPETIHPKILSIMGDEALSAQVVVYNIDEEDDSHDKVDISVQASMACLRVVFLNYFVTRTLNFINSFEIARQAIMNAAAGAAEAAKQNVQEAYTKAVKLSLDVKLQAPLIVIPVNSKSLDVLFLDLGHLTIANKFRTLNIRNTQGHVAVLDESNLDLVNLKLSR